MVVVPSSRFVELPRVNHEKEREEREENASDLKSEHPGGMCKRAPHGRAEASCTASHAAASLGQRRS